MRVFVICSKKFYSKIDEVKKYLEKKNIEVILPNCYDDPTAEQQAHYKKVITDSIDTVNVVAMKDTDNKNTWLWLTINEKETNKLSTLSKIIEKMSISLDEVIFFGDAENDLLILENVGMGVAMGNAIDEVKHKAKAITSTNDEEGIYEYLNKNLILRK